MPAAPWTYLEKYFLDLVNQTRAAAGVAPLSKDAELLTAARGHSASMDQYDLFSHTGADGSSAGERIADEGYGFLSWGENIAWATGGWTEGTVQALHTALVNSPGHYANMVNPNFTEIGIGLKAGTFQGQDVLFVTENFGTPNAQEQVEPDIYLLSHWDTPVKNYLSLGDLYGF
jgi:serralysin